MKKSKNNLIIEKSKRYTFNQLIGRLSNGKEVYIYLIEKEDKITYKIELCFWRADILEKKYPKETYLLTIKKYDARYYSEDTILLIDKRIEFPKIENLLDYLEENNFIKKRDIIKDES